MEDPSVDGGQEECRSKKDTDKKVLVLYNENMKKQIYQNFK